MTTQTLTAGTWEVDPVSRIEGHLGVKVTTDTNGVVTEANAHGNLWRGFENFLVGRRVNDAITFTQRICGVCPVPHGTASTLAADSVMGISDGYATFDNTGGAKGIPSAGLLVRNLVLASEFLMSSITHFYHLVAQDYVQGPPMPPWTPYFDDRQYHAALMAAGHMATDGLPSVDSAGKPTNLWSAVIKQYVKAIRIRRLCFEASAMFAGRAPMMSMSIAGGTTNNFRSLEDFQAKIVAYRNIMEEVALFVVTEYVPLAFALGALYPEYDNKFNNGKLAADPDTGTLTSGKGYGFGAGVGNFLAWGAFPGIGADGDLAIKGGTVLKGGTITPLLTKRSEVATAVAAVKANLMEYIPRSRYGDLTPHEFNAAGAAYPGNVTRTVPDRSDAGVAAGKYSWLKAPRWSGNPMEVGPLARMVVNSMYVTGGQNLFDFDGSDGIPMTALYAQTYLATAATLDLTSGIVNADLAAGLTGDNLVETVQTWLCGIKGGLSTMDRIRGRAIESLQLVNFILGLPNKGAGMAFPAVGASSTWVGQLYGQHGKLSTDLPAFAVDVNPPAGTVSGFGLTEAPRGALGHFVTASGGNILSYQCVVPTTWNASPKDGPDSGLHAFPLNDGATKRGPMEQAVCGCTFDSGAAVVVSNGAGDNKITSALSGVEVLRVAHTFDPCIACAIH